jgi:hypothetical protein
VVLTAAAKNGKEKDERSTSNIQVSEDSDDEFCLFLKRRSETTPYRTLDVERWMLDVHFFYA